MKIIFPCYEVRFNSETGRGLYATRDIEKKEVVMRSHILVLGKRETESVLKTVLGDYVFTYDSRRTCMLLSEAPLMNHSTTPNISYKIVTLKNEEVFQFVAKTDIAKGAELCHDYGYKITTFKDHKISKQLKARTKAEQMVRRMS